MLHSDRSSCDHVKAQERVVEMGVQETSVTAIVQDTEVSSYQVCFERTLATSAQSVRPTKIEEIKHGSRTCHGISLRVLITDAYPVLCAGLVSTIEADASMQVVGSVARGSDLIPRLHANAADVLVINLVGTGDTCAAQLHAITRSHPHLGIVIFAIAVDFAPELLAAGAHAFVLCTEPDDCLHLAIHAATDRRRYLSPVTQEYVERHTRIARTHRFQPRELEIIKCIAAGLDTTAIADTLKMQYGTVKNYIHCIRNKTGWTTWPQMVSWYRTVYGIEDRTWSSSDAGSERLRW